MSSLPAGGDAPASVRQVAVNVLDQLSIMPAAHLVEAISVLRGKPIIVDYFADDKASTSACGAWVDVGVADLVFISDAVGGVHREHVLMHELAHMLLGHNVLDTQTEADTRSLFPTLSPDLVSRVLARSHYSDPHERQAEELATDVLVNTHGTQRSAWVNDPRARRVAQVLGEVDQK